MASSITQSGGYDYEFVDTNLPDEFQCPICTLVPRDVHQASCCGKMFCKSCLDELKRTSTNYTCPNCREDLTNNHFFKDVNTNRKIRNLNIYCTNRKCLWNGSLQDIDNHLSTCPFQIVECSNKCGTQLKRSNLENHLLNKCQKRKVSCVYCHNRDEYQIIYGDHYHIECPNVPLSCPNNGCEEKIKRCLITQHRDTCPKEEVDCQYSKVGCHEKMKREDIPQHNKDKMEIHLRKAVCMIETLNCTIQQFKVPQQANGGTFLIKMRGFKTLKESNTSWSSPGVYTCPGYKFCLIVHPNGNNDGEGTHVSCYIRLIPGEYDDILEWPFLGEVTVELLNQLEDNNHHEEFMTFDQEDGKRKFKEDKSGLGYATFISHSELIENQDHLWATNDFDFLTDPIQYLKDDMLYFRVTIEIHSETKPWLVGAI